MNVPSLTELHLSPTDAFRNDQLNYLLNQPPHASWIKRHPLATIKVNGVKVPTEYLPIDKVEYLLTRIFQVWRIEVLSTSAMFQSIAVTIRLHYKNPVTGEWSFHDGVGAKSVQVNAGMSAADLGQIKDAAVQMALPAAKSYAIKDAAEHLGTLFGKDLNRMDTVSFRPTFEAEEPSQQANAADSPTTMQEQQAPKQEQQVEQSAGAAVREDLTSQYSKKPEEAKVISIPLPTIPQYDYEL